MPSINRGRVAIQWYAERERRAEERAAKEAAEVAAKAKTAKPKPERPKGTGFTKQQDEFLKSAYLDHTAVSIAAKCGKTTGQVYMRLYQLKLQKRVAGSSAQRERRLEF